MRWISLAVGIVDYANEHYRNSEMRLRFAAHDARAFCRYATFAGSDISDQKPLHRLLLDRAATADRLRSEIADLAAAGPAEVFFLYLSGHGEQGDADGGWFCLADAQPGCVSLGHHFLEELLYKIRAEHVCLVIDCCYAEAVVSNLRFFTELEGRSGRRLIASARRDQRSWEDESLQRSLFSDVLLRALSTDSPIATPSGYVDVEGALLPHLRQQVPLIASAYKKGHVQEPVSGGISSVDLRLPTVASQSLGRPLTPAQAIRAAVRRIAFGAIAAGVLSLLLMDVLVYHLAVDGAGEIVVRPGLRFSFNLQPFHLIAPIDTGFRISNVDLRSGDLVSKLAEGSAWGFRTHVGQDGQRTWLEALLKGLDQRVASATRVLARGEPTSFRPDDDAAPVIEAAFLSRLTEIPANRIGHNLYKNTMRVEIACDQDVSRKMDFALLQSGPEVFRHDAFWMASTAPANGADRASQLFELVKLNAYRFFHRKNDDDRVAEFAAFAVAAEAMAGSDENMEAFRIAVKNQWPKVKGTWCELPGTFALAMATDDEASKAAELGLWSILKLFRRDTQHDLATVQQSMAAEGLARLARRRSVDFNKVNDLVAQIESDGAALSTNIPTHVLLSNLATVQPLPTVFIEHLFDKLDHPQGEFDFDPLTAARLLACNGHFLDDRHKASIKQWLKVHAVQFRTMSEIHEALGCQALESPLEVAEQAVLIAQLSPTSLFPPRVVDYRGEMVISATGDSAAVALGKAAQKYFLDQRLVDQLASIGAARSDLKSRSEILLGLANQWYGGALDPTLIYRRLRAVRSDAVQRELEIFTVVSLLKHSSPIQREAVIGELLRFWRGETEPELRIAIARIVGTTLSVGDAEP